MFMTFRIFLVRTFLMAPLDDRCCTSQFLRWSHQHWPHYSRPELGVVQSYHMSTVFIRWYCRLATWSTKMRSTCSINNTTALLKYDRQLNIWSTAAVHLSQRSTEAESANLFLSCWIMKGRTRSEPWNRIHYLGAFMGRSHSALACLSSTQVV